MQQAKQIAIQLGTYDGITFTPTAEYATPKLYDVWNMTSDWNVEWLKASARQRALEGRDRAGVGGFRYEARVTFRTMLPAQAKAIRDLLNDIFEDPMFPRVVKISEDDNIANGEICNFRGGAYGIRRELTIGRQAVNMEFANLFRLNRVTDVVDVPPLTVVTTNDTSENNTDTAIFQWFDAAGSELARLEKSSGVYSGLQFIGPNSIIYGENAAQRVRIDINRETNTLTQIQLPTLGGGSTRRIDVDENGDIYSCHADGGHSIVRVSQTGENLVSAAEGGGYHVLVDGSHCYVIEWDGNARIFKYERDSLAIVSQTTTGNRFSVLSRDSFLMYSDRIIQCHYPSDTESTRLRIIDKNTLAITHEIEPDGVTGGFIRIDYDTDGNIYVAGSSYIRVYNNDLELISEHNHGISGVFWELYVDSARNLILLRKVNEIDAPVYVFNKNTFELIDTFETEGRANMSFITMNGSPGTAKTKFAVLGLTDNTQLPAQVKNLSVQEVVV